jgi:LPXTG-site transpeptidase (sortase) family protein
MDPNLDGANTVTELGDDPAVDDGVDLDNDGATNDDDPATIQVTCTATALPETGFAPNEITSLPSQPERYEYTSLAPLRLIIPALLIEAEIVGVPWDGEQWPVEWLYERVGYLEGTAYPTLRGNTVLSAHAYLPSGNPGPFADLMRLRWGDEVLIDIAGTVFVYMVREKYLTKEYDLSPLVHEENDWLTLISCRSYNAQTARYDWRQVLRAVLIEVR